MEQITQYIGYIMMLIQSNVEMAPFIVCSLLLLAGFNIPISEDAMIFISAVLAAQNPDQFFQLFTGVFLGAYLSDLICYWLGRQLGPKLWNIKFFANMVSREKVEKISRFYQNYGVLTLIVGRFIPFGVRNGLFLTAGLSKMDFFKFLLSDLIAALITVSLYFYLYFTYGESIVELVKKFNLYLFFVVIFFVAGFYFRKLVKRKKSNG